LPSQTAPISPEIRQETHPRTKDRGCWREEHPTPD
jgi:hypothetical protein